MASDPPDTRALGLEDGDLLALVQGQVTAGQWAEADGSHSASVAEPPTANRGCHTDRDRCLLALRAFGDLDPEPLELVTLPTRWSSRRAHLAAANRPGDPLLLGDTSHATPPDSGVATTP